MQAHPDSQAKRLLGAYYTPTALSDVLARFALRTSEDTVLEPSFGGGAFIRSALERLTILGASAPEKQIYGCDIDAHAFEYLPTYFGRRMGKEGRRFIRRDFLEVDSQAFMIKEFDCILANPPFIGYAKLNETQRTNAKGILSKFNLDSNRCASLWYYFILNSLLSLKAGGRIVFVLPHAFIDNDYAVSLRAYLTENFKTVATFSLPNRIFSNQGTKERVVVLAAQGWKEPSRNAARKAIKVDDFDELDAYLEKLKNNETVNQHQFRCAAGRVSGLLTNAETSLVNEVVNSSYVHSFGDFVDVKIGLVTGDAKFFIFNKDKMVRYGLSEKKHFEPLMRSLKENPGLTFGVDDFHEKVNDGKDYFLLRYEDKLLKNSRYRDYLNEYDLSKIDENKTFEKRDVWCQVDDGKTSDLFLSYMSMLHPRAVLNEAGARCINSTHRGYFKQAFPSHYKKLICLSVLTGFTQVLAELEAKIYGNNMLKMEPGFYSNLKILVPEKVNIEMTNRCFSRVNNELRSGEPDSALKIASQFIFGECFGKLEADHYDQCFEKLLVKLRGSRKNNGMS